MKTSRKKSYFFEGVVGGLAGVGLADILTPIVNETPAIVITIILLIPYLLFRIRQIDKPED